MKTIWNKTPKPLRISLHGGRILHLGPNKTGQVSDDDAQRPAFRRLIERREISLVEGTDAEELRAAPRAVQETTNTHPHHRVVIPTGARTAGGRRER